MIIGKKDNVQENKQKNLILASETPLDWDHHAIASLIQGTPKIFSSSINVWCFYEVKWWDIGIF